MSFKTYPKIFQIGHYENKEIFSNPDDLIYIEEKIDGANFRFMISEDGRIIFGSRTQSIGDSNNDIGGNWKRCVDYIKNKLSKKDLSQFKHLVFFGECCIKHTLNYDWDTIPPFLGFDIFTLQEDRFLDYDLRTKIFSDLGLLTVPLICSYKVRDLPKDLNILIGHSKYKKDNH